MSRAMHRLKFPFFPQVGFWEGASVGDLEGFGLFVGSAVDSSDGAMVVGEGVGGGVGSGVGSYVGSLVGVGVGSVVGEGDGLAVGCFEGLIVTGLGLGDGDPSSSLVGLPVG